MDESIVCHENEEIINSEECSELDTTSTAMMLIMSNDHVITIMDTSNMMDKKCFIYYYFSSTYEVSDFGHGIALVVYKYTAIVI